MLIGFEHIGVVVSDMTRSLDFYCGLLGLRLVLRKPTGNGQGEMAFIEADGGQLELVAPGNVVATPARRIGQDEAGIRHVTFAYDDISTMIDRLEQAGVGILERPRRAYASEVLDKVAFVLDPDGIVVELVERARKE